MRANISMRASELARRRDFQDRQLCAQTHETAKPTMMAENARPGPQHVASSQHKHHHNTNILPPILHTRGSLRTWNSASLGMGTSCTNSHRHFAAASQPMSAAKTSHSTREEEDHDDDATLPSSWSLSFVRIAIPLPLSLPLSPPSQWLPAPHTALRPRSGLLRVLEMHTLKLHTLTAFNAGHCDEEQDSHTPSHRPRKKRWPSLEK